MELTCVDPHMEAPCATVVGKSYEHQIIINLLYCIADNMIRIK